MPINDEGDAMPAPGLMSTVPMIQKGIQNTANRVKGALTSAPSADVARMAGGLQSGASSMMSGMSKVGGPMMPTTRMAGGILSGVRSMFRGPQF